MRTYIYIGIVIIALILQVSFLPALRPFGVVPDLMLVVIAAAALTGPLVLAMVSALGAGFVLDLASGSDFGLKTGLLAITVLLCAFVSRGALQIGLQAQFLAVIVAITLVTALISISQIIFLGGRVESGAALSNLLVLLTLNILVGLSIGPICAKLTRSEKPYEG